MDAALMARVARVRASTADSASPRLAASANGHNPEAATLPAYPVDAFPPLVSDFIAEAARSLDAPPEMIGLPLLGFAAAAIGNTRYLAVKRDWHQRSILWCAVVAPPGSAKTPAVDLARKPLAGLQRAAKSRWDTERVRYERDLAAWDDMNKKERVLVAKPRPPALEHFYSTDTTKEALAVMSAHSAGIAVYRDELPAWVASFGAYKGGRGGDRQDMLSLWSGAPLKIDRKGADSLFSERPAVSVVGGVQPDRLGMLAGEAGQDGFLDRFLWVYADVPAMRFTDDEVREETEDALMALFARLRVPDAGDGCPVDLSPAALTAFRAWHEDNRALQAGAPPLMRTLYAKLPSQVMRLALPLHCLWHPNRGDDVLERETMEDALSLVEFHRAHAGRVLAHFSAVGVLHVAGVPRRILRALERAADRGEQWVTRTALYRALGNAVSADDLSRALAELKDAGLVESTTPDSGGKPAEAWRAIRNAGPE